jgi:hypothetical protein
LPPKELLQFRDRKSEVVLLKPLSHCTNNNGPTQNGHSGNRISDRPQQGKSGRQKIGELNSIFCNTIKEENKENYLFPSKRETHLETFLTSNSKRNPEIGAYLSFKTTQNTPSKS